MTSWFINVNLCKNKVENIMKKNEGAKDNKVESCICCK